MAKDTKDKKVKLPPVLKGPISPLGIRRDYDGDQNEIKADMLKEIDLDNPPPTPPPVVQVPVGNLTDYDTGCPCQQCQDKTDQVSQVESPIQEETVGENGGTVSISICPVSKLAGSKDVKHLVDHIKGYLKVGTILTWDVIQDICVSLDTICNQTKKLKG